MNIFVKAVIVTTIVFVLGLGTGILVSKEQSTTLEQNIGSLKTSVENAELQFLFLDVMKENISCTYLESEANRLAKQTEEMAKEVERYEQAEKISDAALKDLKSRYTSVLIRDWLMLEKIKQTCNGSYVVVLYFYSNENCNKCQDQGIALSYFKIKLEEKLMVFAIDSDLELNIVSSLKEVYNVTELPTLVINNKIQHGFKEVDVLRELFCTELNNQSEVCT